MTSTKINGLISFASNSPGVPTGYGQQSEQLVERMLKSGLTVAAMSNYGHEGGIGELKLRTGKIPHYPRSFSGYSDDILPMQHDHWRAKHPDLKHSIFILYDSWVYKNPKLKDYPITVWTPLDHVTLPPMVAQFLMQDNVTPVAMAPHGQQQLTEAGIACEYIPHAINTKIYKETNSIAGVPARQYLGVKESDFLVGIVAANKAGGNIHRKAFAENLLAFSMFKAKVPEAKLYIHSEPSRAMGGFDLGALLKACNVPADSVIFPDLLDLRYGVPQAHMAGLYSAFDVMLTTSYGEGFGVPSIEAQACGTRIIGSSWAATKDLVSDDGWLVDGYPLWDDAQMSWWKIPKVESIVQALENAYDSERGFNQTSRDFAMNFDADKVYSDKWDPFLRGHFAE